MLMFWLSIRLNGWLDAGEAGRRDKALNANEEETNLNLDFQIIKSVKGQ